VNHDLLGVIGCGQTHNEAAWASRLPAAFRFMLSLWDEANLLAHKAYPSTLEQVATTGSGGLTGVVDTLAGRTYVIESSNVMANPTAWGVASTVVVESLPWSVRSFSVTNAGAPGANLFIRSATQ
jgi:hypothetical protein